MRRLLLTLIVLAALGMGLVKLGEQDIGPVVITAEDQQKLIFVLDRPSGAHTQPGIWFRWPLFSTVRSFDRRWLTLNSKPLAIQTRDRERIVVDSYVMWRIADPLVFFNNFPQGLEGAERRIDREVNAKVREVIGQKTLNEVVTTQRVEIMENITGDSAEALGGFGIEVKDVRINRTELPAVTEKNVYARMRAERERLARKNRAEGESEARTIRAKADREARILVANARRDSEIQRGTGDAESTRIYAEAYSQDPSFYEFQRNLEAYRKTLGEGDTMVLPPSHEFFELFGTGGQDGVVR